jgi:hypothetical protein
MDFITVDKRLIEASWCESISSPRIGTSASSTQQQLVKNCFLSLQQAK